MAISGGNLLPAVTVIFNRQVNGKRISEKRIFFRRGGNRKTEWACATQNYVRSSGGLNDFAGWRYCILFFLELLSLKHGAYSQFRFSTMEQSATSSYLFIIQQMTACVSQCRRKVNTSPVLINKPFFLPSAEF